MRLVSYLRRLAQRWAVHDNSRSAAAIGFYAIFTIAPMLVLATAGLGLIVGDQEARSLTEQQLAGIIGPSGARITQDVLANADFKHHGAVATAVSAVLLLYGASAMFYQLRKTLDRIFGRPKRSVRGAVLNTLLGRLIAACSVIVAAAVLIAALVAQVVLSWVAKEPLAKSTIPESVWQIAPVLTTAVIVLLLVAAMLKYLPSQRPRWRHALLGAVVTVVFFELAKWLVGLYISKSMVTSAYGPSSAIVAFVLWIFFSSQFFILGAEVCQLLAEENPENPAKAPTQ